MADTAPDKALLDRLPLPLAQLYRRAHNAKTSRDAHDCAVYLWEAVLKLLASAAIVTAAADGPPSPGIAERLKNLARPSLGHWREFVRLILPTLGGRESYRQLGEILEKSRADLPRCAALDAALREALGQGGRPRQTVCVGDLLDRVVEYRNKGMAHAAPAARGGDTFRPLAVALLAAAGELFARFDVLAGRLLIAVTEVRTANGTWLVERSELRGVVPWRAAALEVPRVDGAGPPLSTGVYLTDPASAHDPAALTSLHPLIVYDGEHETAMFLNSRRGRKRVELLCYATGRTVELADAGAVPCALLARVLGVPVTEAEASAWAAVSQADEPEAPLVEAGPRRLGDYELVSELGRGAMGIVYRARQIALGREVALKIQPRPGDAKADARFRREIRALGRVDHPNLVKVFTSGVEGEQFYYTMELVDGAPLAAVCDALTRAGAMSTVVDLPEWQSALSMACQEVKRSETPLSATSNGVASRAREAPENSNRRADDSTWHPKAAAPGRAYVGQIVTLIRQVADAAHALHEAGVLHRDIKPGNVQVSPDGRHAFLLDLGLAQLADDVEGRLTRTRQFVGTLRYAGPQQVLAAGTLDRRGDVYSLGATLWELLALRPLFGATDEMPIPELMEHIQRDEPERLRRVAPIVGRDLEAVVHKCLEKDPARRYATAKELADDLGRWLDGEPVKARPVGQLDRAAKWLRRRPTIAALYAALLALVVVGVGSVIAYQRVQITEHREREASERQTRAAATVDALKTADISSVPLIVEALKSLRAEADPLLRERHAAAKPESPERLRFALALLPSDPDRADELLAFVQRARADELLVLREALRDYADKATTLWLRLEAAKPAVRLRLAAFLAGFLPADERWQPFAAGLVGQLVRSDPLELAAWSPVFDSLRRPLTPALLDVYRSTQDRLKTGELDVPELVASVAQFDLSATLLARYGADQPEVLAELLQAADSRHYEAFLEPARAHRASVSATLHAVVARIPDAAAKDAAIEALRTRQAHAAATLIRLGEPGPAWIMLRHTPDPTARSYLIHDSAPRGVDPLLLMGRYAEEADVSARRALLLGLGEYDAATLPPAERDRLTQRLLDEFRTHPDAGMHGAIDWLLRQKWGRAADLDRIATELRGQPAGKRDWFVAKEGQTFSVIHGPVELMMGPSPGEPGRFENEIETQYRKRIDRSFAIAAREVTVAEFLRFRKLFKYVELYATHQDGPINNATWFDAAAFCRWLSEQDGVPEDQMCYPPIDEIKPGVKLPDDYLKRTGYRLPTDAEWEFACRAGATTARPYGRGTHLLSRYEWFQKNSRNHLWPCGRLKPNDLGLFDMLGNAHEWCQDAFSLSLGRNPTDDQQMLIVTESLVRFTRGSSFNFLEPTLRSANRGWSRPDSKFWNITFRPARTLP